MMGIQKMYQDLNKLGTTDFLTKVLNRRAIEQYLQYEIARFEQNKIPFSLILIDVDEFKFINHNHGHLTGDLVLKNIVKTLKKHLRSQDLISRWGGEEFMIVLPNTNLETAAQIAEKLRVKVASDPINEPMIYYTISLGVGTFEATYINSLISLFIGIDEALYQAKINGKNQVVVVPKTD
jgi:diguanylate cyclase (GGDEF)-like protein